MLIDFAKMDGLGNDFIVVDDMAQAIWLSSDEVASLCDRHFGVGADGIILARPATEEGCVAQMYYINADGSLAQMCGNGIRCLAKFLADRDFPGTRADVFTISTLSGVKAVRLKRNDEGLVDTVTVNMGQPAFDQKHPTITLESPWGTFTFYQVSMGNPHAVCFIEEDNQAIAEKAFLPGKEHSVETLRLAEMGAFFSTHAAFPEGTNVEFVAVEPGHLRMRVYERGCGPTLACGTGACATLVAAVLDGISQRTNVVQVDGGPLNIEWLMSGEVLLTGPARQSFTGTIDVPTLNQV